MSASKGIVCLFFCPKDFVSELFIVMIGSDFQGLEANIAFQRERVNTLFAVFVMLDIDFLEVLVVYIEKLLALQISNGAL